MKIIAFNGSPRPEGNTAILINRMFSHFEKEGIETELIQIGNNKIKSCLSCFKCMQNRDQKCIINDDILNDCIQKMKEADAIILGSPTYWANITPDMKGFIDRAGLVSKSSGDLFMHKIGAAVVSARRAGAVNAMDAIHHFFSANEMFIAGTCYWSFAIGKAVGEVMNDEEGLRTMDHLAENIIWFLKKTSGK